MCVVYVCNEYLSRVVVVVLDRTLFTIAFVPTAGQPVSDRYREKDHQVTLKAVAFIPTPLHIFMSRLIAYRRLFSAISSRYVYQTVLFDFEVLLFKL